MYKSAAGILTKPIKHRSNPTLGKSAVTLDNNYTKKRLDGKGFVNHFIAPDFDSDDDSRSGDEHDRHRYDDGSTMTDDNDDDMSSYTRQSYRRNRSGMLKLLICLLFD